MPVDSANIQQRGKKTWERQERKSLVGGGGKKEVESKKRSCQQAEGVTRRVTSMEKNQKTRQSRNDEKKLQKCGRSDLCAPGG